jgi:hypothetical protein
MSPFNEVLERIGTKHFVAKPVWLTWVTSEVEVEVGDIFSVFENGSVRIGTFIYPADSEIAVGVGPGRFVREEGSRVLTYESPCETRLFAYKFVPAEGPAWVELIPMAR